MRFFSIFIVLIYLTFNFAADRSAKIDKSKFFKASIKSYQINDFQASVPNEHSPIPFIANPQHRTTRPVVRSLSGSTHVLVDSSRNGFGWLDPGIRSIDRFKGNDGNYHYCGVYRDWITFQYIVFYAEMVDPALGWTVDPNPVVIDTTNTFVLYPVVSINSSGFGAVGRRHLFLSPEFE